MKVLQIANYKEGVGGISVQVKLLKDKLLAEGCECDIISTKGSAWQRFLSIASLLKIGKNYDIFHVHACSGRGFLPAIIGISAGRLLGKRVILTYHGGGAREYFERRTKLVKHYLTRTSANIVLSDFIGSLFDRFGLKYTIIPNIIELDAGHFKKREVIHPHFICIRSLSATYNIECLLRAFKAFQNDRPDAVLTLLGDGPLRSQLESFVESQDIKNVHFMGQVSNDAIYDQLDQADIMVSTSRFDNMPVSILEGFNAGLLVIASDVGGIPYMIENGKNGLLFESNDDKMLAEKMAYAVENQELSITMIANARKSLDRYSWENSKGRLLDLYYDKHGVL